MTSVSEIAQITIFFNETESFITGTYWIEKRKARITLFQL